MAARCDRSFGETSEAIFLTQGYVYDTAEAAEARFKGEEPGFIYSRYANPTVDMFEKRMCALEGAEDARATASGMAAVAAAILCSLKAGDHIVAARALFGSCRWVVETLAPKYGIEATLVDGTVIENWEKAVKPNTKLFFLESPTNPTLEVIDIAAVAELANSIGARLVVDNVFATPLQQKPLELGAHIVVYSATKHIDGQGRCLGGIILSDKEWIDENLHDYFRHTGPSLSPFNAWTLLKGLETLPLQRAPADARAPQGSPISSPASRKSPRVIYPGRDDHPQADIMQEADDGRLDADLLRPQGREGRRLRASERAGYRADLQQSRRRQEPDHPSGDDDAQEPDRRGARRTRHRAGHAAAFGRPRGCRRPDRGYRRGAGAGGVAFLASLEVVAYFPDRHARFRVWLLL